MNDLFLHCIMHCTLCLSCMMWCEFHLVWFAVLIIVIVVIAFWSWWGSPWTSTSATATATSAMTSWPSSAWHLAKHSFHCNVVVQHGQFTFSVGQSCIVHDVGTVRTPWLLSLQLPTVWDHFPVLMRPLCLTNAQLPCCALSQCCATTSELKHKLWAHLLLLSWCAMTNSH